MAQRSRLINLYLVDADTIIQDILELFKEGYRPTPEDDIFLNNQYKVAIDRSSRKIWRFHIEKLTVSIFYTKVNKIEFSDYYSKVRFILSGLLSLKLNLSIFQNPISLPEYIAESGKNYPEYTALINRAITHFEVEGIPIFPVNDSIQQHEYDWIFKPAFPELFN